MHIDVFIKLILSHCVHCPAHVLAYFAMFSIQKTLIELSQCCASRVFFYAKEFNQIQSCFPTVIKPDRWQSKMVITIDERSLIPVRNRGFRLQIVETRNNAHMTLQRQC